MSNNKKAAAKSAAPKKVYFIVKDKDGKQVDKYELLGKRFVYKGEKYSAENAVKNKELMASLIKNQAPAIKKV